MLNIQVTSNGTYQIIEGGGKKGRKRAGYKEEGGRNNMGKNRVREEARIRTREKEGGRGRGKGRKKRKKQKKTGMGWGLCWPVTSSTL